LHALTGIVAAAALVLIGLTGIYYAYRDTTTAVVTLVSGNAALPQPCRVRYARLPISWCSTP